MTSSESQMQSWYFLPALTAGAPASAHWGWRIPSGSVPSQPGKARGARAPQGVWERGCGQVRLQSRLRVGAGTARGVPMGSWHTFPWLWGPGHPLGGHRPLRTAFPHHAVTFINVTCREPENPSQIKQNPSEHLRGPREEPSWRRRFHPPHDGIPSGSLCLGSCPVPYSKWVWHFFF